ncbi:MAG: hypothetical protein ACKV2U_06475, partial [Bryobacteraceae bacterium]
VPIRGTAGDIVDRIIQQKQRQHNDVGVQLETGPSQIEILLIGPPANDGSIQNFTWNLGRRGELRFGTRGGERA